MPLSEHEQRLLDQIERALYQDDPKFATAVRSSDLRTHTRRRLRRAGYVLGLGVVLLLAGVIANQPLIGLSGFVVMLGALLLALSSWRRIGPPPTTLQVVDVDGRAGSQRQTGRPAKRRGAARGDSGSLLGRLEERWNKRWDERGREQ